MVNAMAIGPYFKFPLLVSDLRFGASETMPSPGDVQMAVLIFEPIGVGYRCVNCGESRGTDRAWTGPKEEIDAHCEAHQMGFDYALAFLRKAGRLK